MPDRPRRLVTYGKSAHKRTERKQRAPPSQAQEENHSNGLTSKVAKIGASVSSEKDQVTSSHVAFRDAVADTRNRTRPQVSGSPSQSSRPSNRSPKRRKLSPEGDDSISPASSPRLRTRRGAATQTTYARKDSLRRSLSDISHAMERPHTRNSLSPDGADHAAPINDRGTHSQPTEAQLRALVTPSRRRLVDSLRSLDDNVDNAQSGSDSPRQVSDADISRESTPIPDGYRKSQDHGSRAGLKLHGETYEEIKNVASPQSISPKITYSRQRSFLRSVDVHGDRGSNATPVFSADLFSLPVQPASVDKTETDQPENSRTVRSIHELRRAGVNARFQGLVDSIFEDIEDRSSSASARRSGFIQLCEKLLDETFTQRFVENGSFERLAKCMPTQGDLVAIILSVYACALVLRLGHLPPTVYSAAWSKLIVSAPALLPLDDAIPKFVTQRRQGLSRINQTSIRDISTQFNRLLDLKEQESLELSPRRLSLRTLHTTIRKVREKDLAGTIPVEVTSQLVNILLELAQQATNRDVALDNLILFESIITILETYTTSSDMAGKAQQDVLMPLADSSQLLFSLSNRSEPEDMQVLNLHLRLILNITNASPSLCEKFATADLIDGLTSIVLSNYSTASDEFVDEKKDSLDIVILALGALINLTEVSEAARQNVIKQKKGSQSLLERLVSIFTKGLQTVSEADSVVQTHSNVAFGYLSILLCTLCIERQAYESIRSTMNGAGLERLLATVEEFLHYHRKVDEELHQSQSLKEFTTKLQKILNQIRTIDHGA